MQNFALDLLQMQKVGAVELEIKEAQASALGITGSRLAAAVAEYGVQRYGSSPAQKLESLAARICDNLQELLIQRESLGLAYQNLEWVLRIYDIPQEILSKLGLRDDPDRLSAVSGAQDQRDIIEPPLSDAADARSRCLPS